MPGSGQAMIQGKVSMSEWDNMLSTYEAKGGLEAFQLYTDEMNRQNGQ